MKDENKTKKQLIGELTELRQYVVELKQRIVDLKTRKQPEQSDVDKMRIKDNAIESSINAIAFADLEGNITYVNDSFIHMWGYEREEDVLGHPLASFWADERKAWEMIRELGSREKWIGELTGKRRDGSFFDVQLSANMIKKDDGTPLCMMGSFVDITEQKQAEKALKEDEERYRSLFESTKEGIIIANPDGTIMSANPAAAGIIGYDSPEQLQGRMITDFYAEPEKRKEIFEFLNERGFVEEYEVDFKRKDGTSGQGIVNISIQRDEGGRILRTDGIFRDITERKRMEQALKESEGQYRELVEEAGLGILIDDHEGNFTYCNTNFADIFGYTVIEIMKKSIPSLVHPDDVERVMTFHRDRIQDQQVPSRYDFKGIRQDGALLYLEVYSVPVKEKGAITGTRSYIWNVTERKQVEEALRESEEKYRELVENIDEVIYTVTREGVIDYISPTVERCIEYPPFEVIGRHFSEFVYEEDLPELSEAFQSILSGIPAASEYRLLSKSGEIHWMHSSGKPMLSDGRIVGLHGVLADITERKLVEQALRESEERFRRIFDNALIGIYRTTPDGQIDMANPSLVRMLGYASFEELSRRNLEENGFEPEYQRSEFKRHIEQDGQVVGLESAWRKKNGDVLSVRESARIVRDESGRTMFYEGTVEDITERKMAEGQLQLLSSSVEQSTEGIAVSDLDGNLLFVNHAFAAMHGYASKDLIGKHLSIFHTVDQMSSVDEANRQIQETGQFSGEIWHKRQDGTTFPSFMNNSLLRDETGTSIGMIGTVRDITERKKTEEALRESEQKFRDLAEQSPNMIFINKAGRVVYANKRCEEIMGYMREEFYAQDFNYLDLIAPEFVDHVRENFEQHMKGEGNLQYDYTVITKEGQRIDAIISTNLISYEGDMAILGIITDITEHKNIEVALRDSELRYRTTIESMGDPIHVIDTDFRILLFNQAFYSWIEELDLERDVIGRSVFDVFPFLTERIRNEYNQVVETGETLVTQESTKVGDREFITETRKIPVFEANTVTRIVTVVRDITEQKKADEALRESEARFRTAIESLPFDFFVIDSSGRYTMQNTTCKNHWGDIIGKRPDDLFVERETLALWQRNNSRAMAGELVTGEVSFDVKGEKQYYYNIISPIYDVNRVQGILGVNIDITDRKHAEEKIRASLKEKEALLQEIHHRVKNNLQVISGLLLLQSRDIKDEHTVRMLAECQNRIKSMAKIHERLYQTGDLARINFSEYLPDFAEELMNSYGIDPKLISLDIHVDEIYLSVDTAVPCGLIINELLSNALKHAFPERKKGIVDIYLRGETEGDVTLIVKDNGIGLPEHLDFRQTSTLGLQLVITLTEQLDGTIDLERDGGTMFTINFRPGETE